MAKSNNSQRRKPYALMLLLAFGAAVLGVMVLHKLREKRIFTLLVKQKDNELLTLQLLFQREKELNNEARKKVEEMKNKIYLLRSQKLELDRRLLDMESTIASMRDERKVIESTVEENKNEIKMLSEEGMNSSSSLVFSQVAALQDTLKSKEAEIEELKLQLNKTNNYADPTGFSTRQQSGNHGMLQLNRDLSKNVTKSEDGSQIDGTNGTGKVDDMEDDDPRMRREAAALYKWVYDEQREHTRNGGNLINKDESQEKETTDTQRIKGSSFRADANIQERAKPELISDVNADKNDTRQTSDGNRSQAHDTEAKSDENGVLLEKSDGTRNGLAYRVRRRHFRGDKRLRNIAGNGTQSLTKGSDEGEDAAEIENKIEDRLPRSSIHNQTLQTASVSSLARERQGANGEEAHIQDNMKSKLISEVNAYENSTKLMSDENKSQESAKPKLISEVNSDENDRKQQVSDANDSQTHDTEANRKLLKMHNTNVKYDQNDKDAEGETEDSEDPEISEPEIDKADIQRFSESDPDEEEEAEAAAEETEF